MSLSDADRQYLLRIAACSVRAAAAGREPPAPPEYAWPDPTPRGVFVSLHRGPRLRGCIGTFAPAGPLPQTVRDIAVAAAEDPRFVRDPVSPAECGSLDIELSVISPLQRTGDPLSLQVGLHGVLIRAGGHSGCFLPQVAVEAGWNAEEFLSACCESKAHTGRDLWRDPDTEVYLFTTEVFSAPMRSLP